MYCSPLLPLLLHFLPLSSPPPLAPSQSLHSIVNLGFQYNLSLFPTVSSLFLLVYISVLLTISLFPFYLRSLYFRFTYDLSISVLLTISLFQFNLQPPYFRFTYGLSISVLLTISLFPCYLRSLYFRFTYDLSISVLLTIFLFQFTYDFSISVLLTISLFPFYLRSLQPPKCVTLQ
jgi:hypothetical protein